MKIKQQTHGLVLHLLWVVLLAPCAGAWAQNVEQGPLYMQTPFDRIILKSGQKVDVSKLVLPWKGRTIPEVLPTGGNLKVRPLTNALTEGEVAWTSIARIDLFEDMILQEGVKLTKEGKFDDAYPYFSYLLNRAPDTRQLDQAVAFYLQSNAIAAFNDKEYDRALAILGSLFERTPKAPRLASSVDTVAGKIIENYLEQQNYRSARMTLDVVDETFHGLGISVVKKYRDKFQADASSKLAEAKELADARQYLAARQAITEAVGVWPEQAGVVELQERLQREHPVVSIGVMEQAPSHPSHRLDSLGASRAASLLEPTLVELRGFTNEGGDYQSSVGELEVAPNGKEIDIRLFDAPSRDPLVASLAASALARHLLEAADPNSPEYDEAIARIVTEVVVEYPQTVHVKLAHTHVRPEALLTLPMSAAVAQLSNRGVFTIAERSHNRLRYTADADHRGAIAEIHEVNFDDDEELITALAQGTVDVIDRVPPWQIARLKAIDDIQVDTYRLPTVHALVPTGRSKLTDQREFRRALCYGIDRDTIIRQVLLAGNNVQGFQPISGPFPAGLSLSDPIRYGYNSQVKPRAYDPYMAIVLSSAAWTNTRKMQGVKEPDPDEPMPKLTLGHSSDAVARTACIEIAKNVEVLGLKLELVELSADEMLDADELVDLKYVELETWEPLVDARRLLGADGLLGESSDFMMLSLDRLDDSVNWSEVGDRLHEIHDVASTDLPVIPLWQTVNYFAYRRTLSGITPQPVTLFQDIANWQLEIRTKRP